MTACACRRFQALALYVLTLVCTEILADEIPITTSSDEARQLYLKARDFNEKLRFENARVLYAQAVEADQSFAIAHLGLAFTATSNKGFFASLDKAVELVEGASEGERHMIQGAKTGIDGFPARQRAHYQALVTSHSDDPRAHNLLGNHYFGQQDYDSAIATYERVVELDPEFSPSYNQMGYAYRFRGDFDSAGKAFEKYIELIPDDPNPYDSYAELLMKKGDFGRSIEIYRQALAIDVNFVPSHIGIATDMNLSGDHEGARQQLDELLKVARNDGERRQALTACAVSYADEGSPEEALKQLDRQLALAEKIDEASAKYEHALELVEKSDLSDEVKANAHRGYLFNSTRVAVAKGDLAAARASAADYREKVESMRNTFQIRLAHQLAGSIALAEGRNATALAELAMANQQNPRIFLLMAQAAQAAGDAERAKKLSSRAAHFNALNSLNYALIRSRSLQMLEAL